MPLLCQGGQCSNQQLQIIKGPASRSAHATFQKLELSNNLEYTHWSATAASTQQRRAFISETGNTDTHGHWQHRYHAAAIYQA